MKRVAGVMVSALTSAWLLLVACTGSDADPNVPHEGGTAASDSGSLMPIAGNVAVRSGFEDPNCLGWTGNQASLDLDTTAQGGKTSCRVCAVGASSVWGIYQHVPAPPVGDYTVTAYVHASGDGGVQRVTIGAQRLDDAGQEGSELAERPLDIAAKDATWQTTSFDFSVAFAGESMSIGASVSADTLEGCFLVDEFTVAPKK